MNGIQGMGGMMGMGGMQPRQALTSDQKKQVQSILSNYDPENITASDAKEIFHAFEDAGITPVKGLKEAIEEAGFDAGQLRSMAMPDMQGMQGVRMGPPPGPPPGKDLTEDQKALVVSILSNYDPETVTAEDAKAIFDQFKEEGLTPTKGMKEAIESAGFDNEQLRSLAMPPDNMDASMFQAYQDNAQGINIVALQSLQTILNQYDLYNLSSEQESSLFSQLFGSGLLQSSGRINIGA